MINILLFKRKILILIHRYRKINRKYIFFKKVDKITDIYSLNKDNLYSKVEKYKIFSIYPFHTIDKNKFIFFFEFIIDIVLKSKYGIIIINSNLLIIDILTGEIIKKYILLIYNADETLIYFKNYEVKKWNIKNDNEFILIINGNITLFELNDKSGINLEIIAYSYFKNFNDFCKAKSLPASTAYRTYKT